MSTGQIGWIILFLISLMLITIGYQGNLGLLIGIVFCPQYIIIGDEAQT